MEWYVWLAIVLVLIAVEALTLDLVLFMFAGGALGATIIALFELNLGFQIVTFAVLSVLLVFSLRPWLLRNLRKRGPLPETNMARVIGEGAVVLLAVNDAGGRIKFNGEVWTARSANEETFAPGDEVVVTEIDGATAVITHVPAGATGLSGHAQA